MALRPVERGDVESCAQLLHDAFTLFAKDHGLPSDFPTVEYARNSTSYLVTHSETFGLLEEVDGATTGFGFIYERDPIRAIGPIAVAPEHQRRGTARRVVSALLARAEGTLGVRLVTDTFNQSSLPLYIDLGFVPRETCLVVHGKAKSKPAAEYEIRPVQLSDLDQCAAVCKTVHGIERTA